MLRSKKFSNLLNFELNSISAVNQPIVQKLLHCSSAVGVSLAPLQRYRWVLKSWSSFILFLCIVVIIGEYNVLNELKHESFPSYAETIVLLLQLIIGMVKNLYLHWQHEKLYEILHCASTGSILRDLEIFKLNIGNKKQLSDEIGQILLKNWHDINFQITYFAGTFFGAIFFYLLKPFIHYIHEVYVLHNVDFHLPLPFEVHIPYWQLGGYNFPPFALRFIIILFQPYCCGFSTITFDGSFILSTLHVVALQRVLRCLLRSATDTSRVPEHLRVEYLSICVRLYARISEYHASIDNFFRNIILAQFASSCMIICIVLYKASLGLESDSALLIKMLLYLMAIVLEISIFNIDAQKVTTESEKLHLDWYNACAWYNQNREFKYIIRMMLLFTKRGYGLGVGGFTQMSHSLLLQIMRMSGNFFLLLRNVNGNS